MKGLKDKAVIVTGGARGIGRHIAGSIAAEGGIALIGDKNEASGAAAAKEILQSGGRAAFFPLDTSSDKSWGSFFESLEGKKWDLFGLVNNAGINIRKSIEEMSVEEWDTMMGVNVRGTFLGMKYILPLLKKKGGGSIINISSVCGLVGHQYTTEAYTCSKGAVTLLTKSVASRHAAWGIRCNSVNPSTVDTPFMKELFLDPLEKEKRLSEIPLGRLATEADVSHAVLFLLNEKSSFINGVAFPVDGGLTAY